jgi:hypothetical protein
MVCSSICRVYIGPGPRDPVIMYLKYLIIMFVRFDDYALLNL